MWEKFSGTSCTCSESLGFSEDFVSTNHVYLTAFRAQRHTVDLVLSFQGLWSLEDYKTKQFSMIIYYNFVQGFLTRKLQLWEGISDSPTEHFHNSITIPLFSHSPSAGYFSHTFLISILSSEWEQLLAISIINEKESSSFLGVYSESKGKACNTMPQCSADTCQCYKNSGTRDLLGSVRMKWDLI